MAIDFWKMSGAGNDFIMVDNRGAGFTAEGDDRTALVARLCARGTGVGADGLILVEESESADFRMRYYNSDGSEAETCGNGARCVARFARLHDIAHDTMRFDTAAGVYGARITERGVRVEMSDTRELATEIPLTVEGLFDGTVAFANSGVPHVVLLVDNMENAPVLEVGRAIRYHERFHPTGVNVNFVAPTEQHDLWAIRTYERGVEDETLACGTGSIAAAVVLDRKGLAKPPLRLLSRSGLELVVNFEPTDTGATGVELEGEARVVYKAQTFEM